MHHDRPPARDGEEERRKEAGRTQMQKLKNAISDAERTDRLDLSFCGQVCFHLEECPGKLILFWQVDSVASRSGRIRFAQGTAVTEHAFLFAHLYFFLISQQMYEFLILHCNVHKHLLNLQRLSLANNQLTHLPPEIGNLTALQILDLKNNKITDLPK